MNQDFTDQTMLKVPKVMDANLVDLETFCQMRANRFNEFSETAAGRVTGSLGITAPVRAGSGVQGSVVTSTANGEGRKPSLSFADPSSILRLRAKTFALPHPQPFRLPKLRLGAQGRLFSQRAREVRKKLGRFFY
jgi:hypothetical protein